MPKLEEMRAELCQAVWHAEGRATKGGKKKRGAAAAAAIACSAAAAIGSLSTHQLARFPVAGIAPEGSRAGDHGAPGWHQGGGGEATTPTNDSAAHGVAACDAGPAAGGEMPAHKLIDLLLDDSFTASGPRPDRITSETVPPFLMFKENPKRRREHSSAARQTDKWYNTGGIKSASDRFDMPRGLGLRKRYGKIVREVRTTWLAGWLVSWPKPAAFRPLNTGHASTQPLGGEAARFAGWVDTVWGGWWWLRAGTAAAASFPGVQAAAAQGRGDHRGQVRSDAVQHRARNEAAARCGGGPGRGRQAPGCGAAAAKTAKG
jgi:hypothetical protein